MKVLLTSGTGYIGAAVAAQLKASGHTIVALAHSDEAKHKLVSAGIGAVSGDITIPESVSAASTGCDALIHTAFVYGAQTAQVEHSLAAHLTEQFAGSHRKMIYTSGVWVYGPCGDLPATEEAPLAPPPLVAWRPEVEQMYLSATARGLHTIVLRPAMVYGGTGGIITEMLASAIKNKIVRYVGTGTNNWSLIHVQDLARLYQLALEKAPAGSIYNGSSEQPMTVHNLAILLSEIAGCTGKVQAWPLEDARKSLGAYADALAMNSAISSAKARKELNWTEREPDLANAYVAQISTA